MGEAHIEIERANEDEDLQDSWNFIVEIGKRTPEEFEQFTDKKVKVIGVLNVDPYKEARESDEIHARVIFGPPQLHNIQKIERVNQ